MVVKHVFNKEISSGNKEDFLKFIKESFEIIKDCRVLLQAFHDYESGEIDDDDLLEVFEDPYFINITSLDMYRKCCYSIYSNINIYLGDISTYISELMSSIKKINDAGVYVKPEWLTLMKQECVYIIGGLSYVIWFDFKLDVFLEQFDTDKMGAEASIDEIIQDYADFICSDAQTVAREIRDNRSEYKFKLDFFDQYPDKEENFMELMGPFAPGINEENLTIQLVLDLEEGKITPIDLCEMCN